jgi:hypothetical protein
MNADKRGLRQQGRVNPQISRMIKMEQKAGRLRYMAFILVILNICGFNAFSCLDPRPSAFICG